MTTVTFDASQALARGEPLRALGAVGRDRSPLARLLCGIAYAQLGDLELARAALEEAAMRAEDGRTEARARAALVEIGLATADPSRAAEAARASAAELDALGDVENASMQRLVAARAEVLIGHLDEARELVRAERARLRVSPSVAAIAWMAEAEIGIRSMRASAARRAIGAARRALSRAPHHAIAHALDAMDAELSRPVVRLVTRGTTREADLFDVESASNGTLLLVDTCRRVVTGARVIVPLARRPIPFALLLALADAWPAGVRRKELASRVFETDLRKVNASHMARLRVELGRLRKLLDGLADPVATAEGYRLETSGRDVAVLLPKADDDAAHLELLLGDGAAWSAQGLAEHLGLSKRTVQRALAKLVESGRAVRLGNGRAPRYARVAAPIASRMLLLGLVPRL